MDRSAWNHSAGGRAAQARYRHSSKGRARATRYNWARALRRTQARIAVKTVQLRELELELEVALRG